MHDRYDTNAHLIPKAIHHLQSHTRQIFSALIDLGEKTSDCVVWPWGLAEAVVED
jgi:hypothetical protein